MNVELKDKIPQQGEYNEYISECLECGYKPDWPNEHHLYFAIGWFQLQGEWCVVWECPKCGEKWFHHDRELEFYSTYKRMQYLKHE